MISVQDALRFVLEDLHPLGSERVMLRAARGRVLIAPVVASRDVPPFRNSAMDGYAVRAADVQADAPSRLRVLEVIGAGSSPTHVVTPGTATKIMTGSPLPAGADAVVRVEDTAEAEGTVEIRVSIAAGVNVREAGEDMRHGDVVLGAGQELRPADIGLLASLNVPTVHVHRRPRVAIVSTGDELVDVGETLGPGQIVNSNAYTLAAAVEEAGGEPVITGVVRDDVDSLRASFCDALSADVVLSTGGVSVGSFDFVREVQRGLGVREKFWRVAQKPGKPLTYGTHERTPVFGLPGNPVSTLVCFYLYVRPALRRLQGETRLHLPAIDAVAGADIPKAQGLTEFVRCQLASRGARHEAHPTGSQSSGVLRSMSGGAVLVVGPPDLGILRKGSPVRAVVLAPDAAADAPPF